MPEFFFAAIRMAVRKNNSIQIIPASVDTVPATAASCGMLFGYANITNNLKYTAMKANVLSLLNFIYECQTKCKYCFNACLEEEKIDMMRRCLKLTVECADICDLTASSLSYEGDFTEDVLAVCIKACHDCGQECRKHEYLHCIECAKACEECVRACKEYMNEYRRTA